jgi:hypothetical protein
MKDDLFQHNIFTKYLLYFVFQYSLFTILIIFGIMLSKLNLNSEFLKVIEVSTRGRYFWFLDY